MNGKTKGYNHHPQLDRFKLHATPTLAVNVYLLGIHREAEKRGFVFDSGKIGRVEDEVDQIPVSTGQVEYEWDHLMAKLAARSPAAYEKLYSLRSPECHPMFYLCSGGIEDWERPVKR